MKTSVIIVTYNSQATIKDCLESLSKESFDEIIVVDNASSDNTRETVRAFQKVKLIESQNNLGFGRANNLGAKNSSGELIFFLNPDCVVSGDSLKQLQTFMSRETNVAVVGPKLIDLSGKIQREVENFPTLISQTAILLRLHRIPVLENLVYPNFDYKKTQEAQHLMGAALMVRRSVFEEVGGFDEKFFLWFEETDLLKRIKDKGYKIVYYPEAAVTHLVGQSTRQLNFIKKQTIWNRSLLYYFKKHKSWATILILLPFLVLSYPAALVSYLLKK